MELTKFIRDIPDFPKKGIIFKDIAPLLQSAKAFTEAVDQMAEKVASKKIDYVVAVEARGFIFGSALAYKLGCGVIPVRKKGKLPYKTTSVTYNLEYGTDTLEMHEDALERRDKVLLVDDLLATGGTVGAVAELVEKAGGEIVDILFVVELSFLKGRDKLSKYSAHSLIKY